ncbi:MAG: hypothetical protein ACRDT4_06075 [Micromonosporaceae bacterium]
MPWAAFDELADTLSTNAWLDQTAELRRLRVQMARALLGIYHRVEFGRRLADALDLPLIAATGAEIAAAVERGTVGAASGPGAGFDLDTQVAFLLGPLALADDRHAADAATALLAVTGTRTRREVAYALGQGTYLHTRRALTQLLDATETQVREDARRALRRHRHRPRLTLDAGELLARGDELLGTDPPGTVHLTGVRPVLAALAGCPTLARIPVLDLHDNHLGDDAVAVLLASPYLRGVRYLGLIGNDLTDATPHALCAADLPALAMVSLPARTVRNPVEQLEEDWTGAILDVRLPPFGEELESRSGYQPWLHAPSSVPNWPSTTALL